MCSVVVLLWGEMEVLEKEFDREVEVLVILGVVVALPCRRALEGGGGMIVSFDEVVGASAALIDLARPLVLRGE